MIRETRIFRSRSYDPWYNLAVEEYLLDNVQENQCILYLWQNQNTVVIGKNQNPWKECRTQMLESEGGKLARRLSGGGAVFHDTGNVNFTFLMQKENYDYQKQSGVILSTVRGLGIPAEISGRNDLTAEGRKFSGNAFCFRKRNAYHHGTILVSVDMDKLTRYLQVSQDKIKSKGVESVRSRVVNLSEYVPALETEEVMEAFAEEFQKAYGTAKSVQEVGCLDQEVIAKLYEKYASWEWRYGEAPKFDVELSNRFPWGGIDIGLRVEKGVVTHSKVYSDAMDEEFINLLSPSFKGAVLVGKVLAGCVLKLKVEGERKRMQEDIADWLLRKSF